MVTTATSSSSATPQPSAALASLPAPSAAVRSLLHERWQDFDEEWPRFDTWFHDNRAVCEFGHARATFREHLRGTFGLCAAWGLSQAVCRAGMLHTTYSGDVFYFALARSENAADRAAVRNLVGEEAERLVHLFGAVHRGTIIDVILSTGEIPAEGVDVRWNRAADAAVAGAEVERVSARDCASLMLLTVADYLEQAVASNAWKDIYQVDSPHTLWPGSGKPATCLHWLSKLARAARPHLPEHSPVPPIFDGCSATLSEAAETKARNLYWQVVRAEDADDHDVYVDEHDIDADPDVTSVGSTTVQALPQAMSDNERVQRLRAAVRLNPFVGEPHVLLAQVAFRRGHYKRCVDECAEALRKLYALGTAWDKRIGFPGWCAFTRLIALRASRRAQGHAPPHDFPRMPNGLSHIDAMLDEIEALER